MSMEEMSCPICKMPLQSDANVRDFCMLCGMGLPDIKKTPKYKHNNGYTVYFCCNMCLSIFKANIVELLQSDIGIGVRIK